MSPRKPVPLLIVIGALLIGSGLLTAQPAPKKKGRFWVCETPHYTIETDVSADFARDLADQMESCHAAYSKFTHGTPRFTGRSAVRVFKQQSEFMRVTHDPNKNVAGCYDPNSRVLYSYLGDIGEDEVYSTLRHEGFHQFFDKWVGQDRPAWIDEGLAGYFEHSFKEGKEIKTGIVMKSDVALLKQAFSEDNLIPLRDLMLMDVEQWNRNTARSYAKARLQYLEARLLVQFMMGRREYLKMLDSYVQACARGAGLEQGIKTAFGNNLASLSKAFMEWLKQLKPNLPESCTLNLYYLARVLQAFGEPSQKIESPAALLAMIKSSKKTDWKVQVIGGAADDYFGPDDMETIEKWFHCPRDKREPGHVSYEFLKSESQVGYPDIICRHHAPMALRAAILPTEQHGITRTAVTEESLKNLK